MIKQIDSVQNPLIKEILRIKEKSRTRNKMQLFLIEGKREILLAIKSLYELDTILFYPEIINENQVQELIINEKINTKINLIEVSKQVYQKITYRETTEGIIALARSKELLIENIDIQSNNPLILVIEAPEKPGNIGALLRTADAANVDVVLIANLKTDIYNPNIIRSSVGCIFSTTIGLGTTSEIIDFLKRKNISIFCAALVDNAEPYYNQDYSHSTAIVVGTEAIGLSQEWLINSYKNISIPMQGKIDSLNVSVSAGILIFEAKRQRNFI